MRLGIGAGLAIGALMAIGGCVVPVEPDRPERPRPTGSYVYSCGAQRVEGGVLTAACENRRGRERISSINFQRCRGWAVGNDNGRLYCEQGRRDG